VRRLHVLLVVVASLFLVAVVLSAFLAPAAPVWAVAVVWAIAGALLAAAVRPGRWWVALGFLWLGVAWIEAGQAVWLERRASVGDVVVGCFAAGLGVGAVMVVRRLRARRAAQPLSERAGAGPARR